MTTRARTLLPLIRVRALILAARGAGASTAPSRMATSTICGDPGHPRTRQLLARIATGQP